MVFLSALSIAIEVVAMGCAALAGRTATRFGVWVNRYVWVLLGVTALFILMSYFLNPPIIKALGAAEWMSGEDMFTIIFVGPALSIIAVGVVGYLVGRYLLNDAVQSWAIRAIDKMFTQPTMFSAPPPYQGGVMPPQQQRQGGAAYGNRPENPMPPLPPMRPSTPPEK